MWVYKHLKIYEKEVCNRRPPFLYNDFVLFLSFAFYYILHKMHYHW